MTTHWDRRTYPRRVGDAFSRFCNTFFFNGMVDESISSRCWRELGRGAKFWIRFHFIVELIFWPIDKGLHCRKSYERDQRQLMIRLRILERTTVVVESEETGSWGYLYDIEDRT